MREIEFRAFLENEMVYDLAFEEYAPINDLLNGCDNLMQYTGLKDKNGVKIFEGDIMAFSKDGNKSFNYEVIYGGISFKLSGESYTHRERKSFEERIVIGNKFENPELLEIK